MCLESVRVSLDSVLGGLKSYQLKKPQCLSPYSTSPFYPGGLQWAKNTQKGEIENRPWPYFFSQLDTMLFRVFSLKLTKETPCGHRQVNSKIFIFCLTTTPRYQHIKCTNLKTINIIFFQYFSFSFSSFSFSGVCLPYRYSQSALWHPNT